MEHGHTREAIRRRRGTVRPLESRVLLATDGSKHARAAAEWLARLSLASTTKVLVVAVAPLPLLSLGIPSSRDLETKVIAWARAAADAAATIVRRRWPATAVRVVEGDPRETIPSVARQWAADLIVLGDRGLGRVKRVLLGSVSSAISRDAPCPILVVKGRRHPRGTVVVAIDGSADALAAARFFGSLRLADAPRVRLVAVVEHSQEVAARRRALERALAGIESELVESVSIERTVRVGRPVDEILRAAAHASLIVLGARGLGRVRSLLLGSVSEQILNQALCPVLVVKRPRRGAPRRRRPDGRQLRGGR